MALLAILLSVVALGCTVIGFLTTPVPVVGLVFSFGAALLALVGIVVAGRALSRAKQAARPTDAAWIAVVLNILVFIPALLVAFTCGVCNAVFSSGDVHLQRQFNVGLGLPVPSGVAGAPAPGPDPADPDPAPQPPSEPGGPTDKPGALPPPPLPAGPRSR